MLFLHKWNDNQIRCEYQQVSHSQTFIKATKTKPNSVYSPYCVWRADLDGEAGTEFTKRQEIDAV